MKNQKGFTLVEGLLIVLILSVVGFAGYTVWNNQQDDKVEKTETTQFNEGLNAVDEENENENTTKNIVIDNEFYSLKLPTGWEEESIETGSNDTTNKNWLRATYNDKSSGYSVYVILNEHPDINVAPGADDFHELLFTDSTFSFSSDFSNVTATPCDGTESYGCNYDDGYIQSLSLSSVEDESGNSYKFMLSKKSDDKSADLTKAAEIVELIVLK